MRLVPATVVDSKVVLVEAIELKEGARQIRLLSSQQLVLERIDELLSNAPHNISASTLGHTCTSPKCADCLKDDLEHLWNVQTAPVKAMCGVLAAEYRSTGASWCPYCSVDTSHSFDHYLPKTAYPEFSIAPTNLIFCCERCNTLKNQMPQVAGARVLNPRRDPVDWPLFRCDLVGPPPFPVPRYSVDVAGATACGLLDECVTHFDRFQLEGRLAEAAIPHLASILPDIYEHSLSWSDRADTAERRIDAEVDIFGVNSWRAMFQLALVHWCRAQ